MLKDYIGVLLALAGYTFTTWHERTLQQREGRIDRVNRQVRLLFGPLLACVNSSKAAYEAMAGQHGLPGRPEAFAHSIRSDPEGPEAQAYRRWMKEVLQPLNERAAALVFEHSDLLDAATISPVLLRFIAHVAANRVMLSEWERGNLAAFSTIGFPDELHHLASSELKRVKGLQATLLGIPNDEPEGGGERGAAPAGGAAGPAGAPRSKL